MEYMQETYPFPSHHTQQQMFYQPMGYPMYVQTHPQQMEDFYQQYAHQDYADFMQPGLMHDEFDDMGEVSTRPRLTKEQVEVLEAQFQAHPKPNSVVKRQLAMQTKLTLPRVANWFQNRRAKAKQQKKQEEFEITQAMTSGWPDQHKSGSEQHTAEEDGTLDSDHTSARNHHHSSPTKPHSAKPGPADPDNTSAKEASWASLQRALNAAKAAQYAQQSSAVDRTQVQLEGSTTMPSLDATPHPLHSQLPIHSMPTSMAHHAELSDWPMKSDDLETWSPSQAMQDSGFDFGFEQTDSSNVSNHDGTTETSPHEVASQGYSLSPDGWQESLPTPRGPTQKQDLVPSPEFHVPAYDESRRESFADDLTANFGTFALAPTSPRTLVNARSCDQLRQVDGHIDLAARRKRPRPAALTSASLRSRSYGAMSSVSPTFRSTAAPTPHVVRHVKSQGHNLNSRYSGIRKASTVSRSPMNFTSFAEAEAFNRLMAQQAALNQSQNMTPTSLEAPLMSPTVLVNSKLPPTDDGNMMSSKLEMPASIYQLPATQHLTLSSISPPSTPFRPEFMTQGRQCAVAPPVSAPPQYASFPDYTPPYSAGPLTNSSWSDAPLTSPELPSFPPVTYIPSLNYTHPENMSAQFQQFVLPSDLKSDLSQSLMSMDQHKTEFFIQEFPNQKEEHAHVAQQLAQQKPKSYVFANSAPSDYDQI